MLCAVSEGLTLGLTSGVWLPGAPPGALKMGREKWGMFLSCCSLFWFVSLAVAASVYADGSYQAAPPWFCPLLGSGNTPPLCAFSPGMLTASHCCWFLYASTAHLFPGPCSQLCSISFIESLHFTPVPGNFRLLLGPCLIRRIGVWHSLGWGL